MLDLDVRTAFLMIGFLYLLLPVITWALLRGQNYLAVTLWSSGGLMFGICWILVSIFPALSGRELDLVAGILLYSSLTLRIQSLRMDLKVPLSNIRLFFFVFISCSVLAFIIYVLKSDIVRAQFHNILGALCVAYIALLANRIGIKEQSNSAFWLAGVYSLVVLVLIFRFFYLQAQEDMPEVDIVNEGVTAYALILALTLTAVVGHFAYVGIGLNRIIRRDLRLVLENAKNKERHQLELQIAHLDRQRGLGAISTSLSHELIQPLTAILSNAQAADRYLAKGFLDIEQQRQFLAKIIKSNQSAEQIINRIRQFIKPTCVKQEKVNLLSIINEANELTAQAVSDANAKLNMHCQHAYIEVNVDAIQIMQVIVNVLRNAIESIRGQQAAEIWIGCDFMDSNVIVSVRDTGSVLSYETLAKIGTPFFTTKTEGLGMGFSISRTIIEKHGGELTIKNGASGGVEVLITLPRIVPSEGK